MIEEKIKTHFYGQDVYYKSKEKKLRFRSLQGGIGWPNVRYPGFAVVIAEQLPEMPKQLPAFYVAATHEDKSPGSLVRACADIGAKYKVARWFCDTDDTGMMNTLIRSRADLVTTSPPYLDEPGVINTYVSTIRDLHRQKRLFLGALEARLLEIGADMSVRNMTRPQELPIVMSLGGALTGMVQYPYDPAEIKRQLRELDAILDDMKDEY